VTKLTSTTMGSKLIAFDEQVSSAPPSAPALQLREVVAGLLKERRKILLVTLVTFITTAAVAFLVVPNYSAQSTLLVLLSKDYAARSEVGSGRNVAGVLDRDAFLKAETDIIASEPLARRVVQQIGVGRLYPRLVHPSMIRQLVAAAVRTTESALGMPSSPSPSLEDLATAAFSQHLSADADKAANVITVVFRHPDSQVAAEAVNDLVAAYLTKRVGLYAEVASTYLAGQAGFLHEQLEDASRRYAEFKASHDIVDYPMQRDILLHLQADLVRSQQSAVSQVAQFEQRLSIVDGELAQIPAELTVSSETDMLHRQENLRTALENLKLREAKLREDYRPDSPIVAKLEGQIRDAAAQLASARDGGSVVRRGRNTVYDELVLDRAHIDQDLQAARVQDQQDKSHLALVGASLKVLESNAVQLADLDQRRNLIESDYHSVEQTLQSRRIVEGADAINNNVRVIEPATPPLSRPHLRAAILVGGVLLSLLAGMITAIFCEVFRRGFIVAEKLERSLGLPVLVVIPELGDLSEAALSIGRLPEVTRAVE
jgi:uncharacterized protein involved in exopolysaccharide biosynthesis